MFASFSQQLLIFVKTVPLAFAALFPVINPLGTAIILLGMTGNLDNGERKALAGKIAFNTVLLLTVVVAGGSYILGFFGLTIPVVQAAGGLVLASMGWDLLKEEPAGKEASAAPQPANLSDQAFYPFTFPVTVGPGGVAVALTLSAHSQHETVTATTSHLLGVIAGIIGVSVLVYLAFAYADVFARRLGPSGTKALLRLMAFILVCLGAEIGWQGLSTLIQQLHS